MDKKSKGKSKSNEKTLLCFECNEQRHYRRDSPKLKKEKEALASIAVSSSIFVDSSEGDDSIISEVLSVSVHRGEDRWILDSDATLHVCLHKALFVEYMQIG